MEHVLDKGGKEQTSEFTWGLWIDRSLCKRNLPEESDKVLNKD